MPDLKTTLAEVLEQKEAEILSGWLKAQESSGRRMSGSEQQQAARQFKEFLETLKLGARGSVEDINGTSWEKARDFLAGFSSARAKDGYSPSETALFVFSIKPPLAEALRQVLGKSPELLLETILQTSHLLDKLGLFLAEEYQKTREDVIARQQKELLELSTPVVRLWENVLALPLIGTLDSSRTQVVMQNLLEAIVATRSDYAIIDITGVPIVDTLVAQHLLKTVAAARLMGADCVISGIRPQIAQTIIHLGVDLSDVSTKATLADAFALVLRRSGMSVVRDDRSTAPAPR